jgi:hypothetical protein
MWRWLLVALALAGCGEIREPAAAPTVDMSKYGPRHAVAGKTMAPPPAPHLKGTLSAGAVGVVGVDGTVGVRPRRLDTASDARMVKLTWSSWTAGGAAGSGRLEVNDCQPTCATGHAKAVPATIALSDVRECAGRSYFARAVVKVAAAEQPASYVRAPC